MRSDDDVRDDMEQARAERFILSRDRYFYDPERERDEEQRADLESEEAEQARWDHRFRRMAERSEVHYVDGPGIDRRLHAVDGDDDRPDVDQPNDIPWPAA